MKKSAYVLFVLTFLIFAACSPVKEPVPPTRPSQPEAPVETEDPLPTVTENGYTVEDAFPDLTFTRPLDIQHAGDNSGRIFIVEQAGRIYVLPGEDATEIEVFLDISRMVNDNGNEQGLLGLAFHPEYVQNGHFFVNYTDLDGTVISRFSVGSNSNRADPASQVEILAFSQPYANHNGGQIAFGPDGYLYIATGDGGSSGDPQGH